MFPDECAKSLSPNWNPYRLFYFTNAIAAEYLELHNKTNRRQRLPSEFVSMFGTAFDRRTVNFDRWLLSMHERFQPARIKLCIAAAKCSVIASEAKQSTVPEEIISSDANTTAMDLLDTLGEIMFFASFGSPLVGLVYYRKNKQPATIRIIISLLITFVIWVLLMYGGLFILFRNGLGVD